MDERMVAAGYVIEHHNGVKMYSAKNLPSNPKVLGTPRLRACPVCNKEIFFVFDCEDKDLMGSSYNGSTTGLQPVNESSILSDSTR